MPYNRAIDSDTLQAPLRVLARARHREISEGVLLDYDADGHLVGIDIDNASNKVQLKDLVLSKLPSKVETVAA
jgi:uncharacterized protein YuzE